MHWTIKQITSYSSSLRQPWLDSIFDSWPILTTSIDQIQALFILSASLVSEQMPRLLFLIFLLILLSLVSPVQASPHKCPLRQEQRSLFIIIIPWSYLLNTLPFKAKHAWMLHYNGPYLKTKPKMNPKRCTFWNVVHFALINTCRDGTE